MLNELLKQKFTSGNDVPVTSVRVTRAEYEQALRAEQVPNTLLYDAIELLRHFTDFPEEDFAGEENFPYTMSVWMNKLRQAREVIAAYDLNKRGEK